MPEAAQVDWGFAFVATEESAYLRKHQRASLVSELVRIEGLNAESEALALQAREWRKRIKATDGFRIPGHWGPAYLMAYPHRMPPVAALTAVGYCQPVPWVEVWDSTGVYRLNWRAGLTLSALRADGALEKASQATLIWPWGKTRRVGLEAWNTEDAAIVPGMRLVGSLTHPVQDTAWLNRALPDFLAHVVTGRDCRRWNLDVGRERGRD